MSDLLSGARLLLDATSAGLVPLTERAVPAPIPLAALPADAVVCSLVYHREPALLAAARARGLRTLDGAVWGACPRGFLQRAIAQAAAAGFTVQAAFEPEWSLARREGDVRPAQLLERPDRVPEVGRVPRDVERAAGPALRQQRMGREPGMEPGDRAHGRRALGTVRSVPPGGRFAGLLAGHAGRSDPAGDHASRISRTRRISCSTVNGFSTKPVCGGMTPSTAIDFSV